MDIVVIGGADGPTSIFIASSISPYVIAFCVAVVGVILWKVRKKK